MRRRLGPALVDVERRYRKHVRRLAQHALHLLVDRLAQRIAIFGEEPAEELAHLTAADAPAEPIEERLEGVAERLRARVALVRILRHRLVADLCELGIGIADDVADARLVAREAAGEDGRLAVAVREARS